MNGTGTSSQGLRPAAGCLAAVWRTGAVRGTGEGFGGAASPRRKPEKEPGAEFHGLQRAEAASGPGFGMPGAHLAAPRAAAGPGFALRKSTGRRRCIKRTLPAASKAIDVPMERVELFGALVVSARRRSDQRRPRGCLKPRH